MNSDFLNPDDIMDVEYQLLTCEWRGIYPARFATRTQVTQRIDIRFPKTSTESLGRGPSRIQKSDFAYRLCCWRHSDFRNYSSWNLLRSSTIVSAKKIHPPLPANCVQSPADPRRLGLSLTQRPGAARAPAARARRFLLTHTALLRESPCQDPGLITGYPCPPANLTTC